MSNRTSIAVALFTALALLPTAPALAQGEIVITQAKAIAGGVTPGDTAQFPVTLSRPGAYILGGNLQVPANKNGLVVTSHNVDIDMNGFRLHGGGVANNGVYSTHGESRIHGGVISSFKLDGVFLNGVGTNSWVVEDMQVVNNARSGISAAHSFYSRFLNNSVLANGSTGISCNQYCHVEGNNVSDNGGTGVRIGSGTVLGNTIFSNHFLGIDNFDLGDDTGFGNNTVIGNNGGAGATQVSYVLSLHPNRCNLHAC